MNKMKLIAAAAALVAAVPAFAKIEVGNNPELVLAVFDEVNKVSFTKDLGTYADAFKGQFDNNTAGATLNWDLKTDSNWSSFLSVASAGNLKWTVFGLDDQGGTGVGQKRLFTTARNDGPNVAKIGTWTNQLFTNGISATALGNYVGLVGDTGTHRALANGSSVNAEQTDGKAYFGKNGSGEFYNSTSPFSNANLIGADSEFFYLTRSGTNQLNKVLVDRFENVDGKASTFKLDANYVLSATAVAAVPEPSTYAMLLGGLLALGLVVRRRTNDKR